MERSWFNSYDPGIPETINPDNFLNIIEPFEQFTERYASLVAFSQLGSQMTYRTLAALSERFAAYLQQVLGLSPGDRFAIMLPNLLQYPVAMFGALRAGLVVVNVNPLYTPKEIIHQLNDAGAKGIIVLANFASTFQLALPQLNSIKHVIVTEVGDLLGWGKSAVVNWACRHIKKMVPPYDLPKAISFQAVLKESKGLHLHHVSIKPTDLAFLQYTGGTTGVSKGAMLTHRNIVANVQQLVSWIRGRTEPGKDTALVALPLYHIFSLSVCCMGMLALGLHGVLIVNPRDLDDFIKQLSKKPISVFIGISTLFNGLLNHPNFKQCDFSKLKIAISGGMATQRAVAERWQKATGVPVLEGYGLTEASPVVSMMPFSTDFFTGSVGLPVPATDVKLCDEQGRTVPAGEEGELWVKGPQVMAGYWQREKASEDVLTEDGWLRTGDIMRMDDRGFLYLVDRKKDMIIVSGFNVYPNELEDVIMSHPGVAEVAVIGIPHEKTGEAIKAFIVKQDPGVTKEGVVQFCRQSLTAYKVPKEIEFIDALPKTPVGKVLRRELRAQ